MRLAFLAAAILSAAPALAGSADIRSVSGMQNHNRVLLVFAPTLTDARIEAQRRAFARFGAGASERDLLFVQVAQGQVIGAHDDEARLRARYHVPVGEFRVLLMGKDGNIVATARGPVSGEKIAARIDAMPMRQDEVRRAQAGHPAPQTD